MTKHLRLTESQFAARQQSGAPSQFWKRTSRESPQISSAAGALASPSCISQRDPAPTKYKNRKVYFDRIQFDSIRECERYKLLRECERIGTIRALVVHPVFPLIVAGVVIGRYTADFRYIDDTGLKTGGGNREVVEDVKSPPTAKKESFRRTVKIIKAQYGIDVRVVM